MEKRQENLEDKIVKRLAENHLSIAAAESCTGGLVAATLINVPGASDVLEESYITYSDAVKHKVLGVSEETLQKHTAVSKEVAEEMVRGVTKVAGTNVGISVTGIAGPGGGSEKFPVGLVYIGYKINDFVKVMRYVFSGDRSEVRMHAVETALQELDRFTDKRGILMRIIAGKGRSLPLKTIEGMRRKTRQQTVLKKHFLICCNTRLQTAGS